MVVEITGSWCPNCHDEAPFLAEMYRKYPRKDFEVVSISFRRSRATEGPDASESVREESTRCSSRCCSAIQMKATAKLSQLVNWNTWPATLFIDRKGLVRSVHSGFPSAGSGELFRQAKEDFNVQVGRLLAEK